jgi:zinc protease
MSHKKLTLKDYGVEKVEKTLKNGLKVILIHKPFAPIYLEFAMRAGAVFDPVGKEGLAHFSEHLLVSGSEKYPKEKFSKIIESIGGYTNAYTSDDMMSVVCEVALPEHLESVKEYFEHSLVHNLINDDKVTREKGVITSEIERYHSSPDYVFHRFVNTELSKDTRYEHSILGSVKTISLFNQEDIHNYLKEVINTSNSILVVAGGVTIEEIEKVFDTMSINKEKSPDVLKKQILPTEAKPITLPFRKHMDQDIPQTNLLVGFLGPEYQSREYEVLSFVYSHIHDGFGSPFIKN